MLYQPICMITWIIENYHFVQWIRKFSLSIYTLCVGVKRVKVFADELFRLAKSNKKYQFKLIIKELF